MFTLKKYQVYDARRWCTVKKYPKISYIVLICALVGSVLLNLRQYYLLSRTMQIDLLGTFQQSCATSPTPKYLVFLRDGQYVLYQDGTVLENGAYSVDSTDPRLYLLEDTGGNTSYIVWTEGSFYFSSCYEEMESFQKISDKPTFLGIDPEPYIPRWLLLKFIREYSFILN